ncbi:MAG: galactokinase [Firmicutes bacterium]|nr:galactokinase [Bacillota bacterium]
MNDDTLKEKFYEAFGREAVSVFKAPGRVELVGNHTDHQCGRVLAAAVDLYAKAAAAPSAEPKIRMISEECGELEVFLCDLEPKEEEKESSQGLVRGIAAALLKEAGIDASALPCGIDACLSSEVPIGSGLSSSAAFELASARMMDGLWGLGLSSLQLAKACLRAENVYFGKPSGLMDQLTGAEGCPLFIDFKDPEGPVCEKAGLDLKAWGLSLIMVNCGAGHDSLTCEYAAITSEMSSVCAYFGKEVLRDVPEKLLLSELSALRRICGDRAVLRALHVYGENRRVSDALLAIKTGDKEAFLEAIKTSGLSSWRLLQNVTPPGETKDQKMAVALALAEMLLEGEGACRVCGGGFAGSLIAFVPEEKAADFIRGMESFLGEGCCKLLSLI